MRVGFAEEEREENFDTLCLRVYDRSKWRGYVAIGHTGLQFRGEIWAKDIHLGFANGSWNSMSWA